MSEHVERATLSFLRKLRPRSLVPRLRRPSSLYLLGGPPTPITQDYGRARGTPVDRFFIDRFLDANRSLIAGRCLEVGSNSYTVRFGGSRVRTSDVLDIDPNNAGATIIGDLQDLGDVPDGAFDCVILTQVLQYVPDPRAAVAELARVTAHGGAVLATLPCLTRIDPYVDPGVDYWRFTAASARLLFGTHFPETQLDIRTWGNARVGLAYWVGMAVEDLRRRTLEHDDPAFPCGVTIKATKVGPGRLEPSARRR